jgi:hypothetical protein
VRPFSTQELLRAWEGGSGQTLVERALLLLAHACPDESPDDLAALPIGRRDGRLLTLREWAFGQQVICVAPCPACDEPLEASFSIEDVRAEEGPPETEMSLEAEGYEVVFRLPDSADLAALPALGDGGADGHHLLDRCVLSARRAGKRRPVSRLPAKVLDAVVRRMAEADPQADMQTALSCPACDHSWQAPFDIVSFFWTEIETWACRVLHDVHVLASAYGWREADILALSPWRRQLYLEMVG